MADFRKSLEVLQDEWSDCEKCDLGTRRKEVDGAFVFGEGKTRGVMFIGEGPGVNEEEKGRPFIGRSGQFLREALAESGIDRYYLTNVVTCRSCTQDYDNEGRPKFRYDYTKKINKPDIVDRPPTISQIEACLPRLYEEIYLVDPLFIVTLGAEAAKVMSGGRKIPVTTESGIPRHITIPGAWHLPNLTEKKRAWARKFRGEMRMPTDLNKVTYLMVPLMHPAYVLRYYSDQRYGSPLDTFVKDMKNVAALYKRLQSETQPSTEEYVPT